MSSHPRRILVVGRDYFFYTQAIIACIKERTGSEVRYVPIEPEGNFYKLVKRMPRLAEHWMDRHHRRAIARHAAYAPDLVLFIQIHQLGDRLNWYRDAFPSASFRLYYWDSIATHDYRPWLDRFEAAFSFDPDDCARNPGLRFLPLFFVPELRAIRQGPEPRFDLSFVGTAVSRRRYDELLKWRESARASGLSLESYLLVSPFLYLSELLRGRRLRDVHFRSMAKDGVLDRYARAAAVLDLPNNSQSGLTMRTFETLGAHRKLVSSNPRLTSAAFHDPACVRVLAPGDALPSRAWLRDGRNAGPAFEAYSLEAWVDRLLGDLPEQPDADTGHIQQMTKEPQ